ncbi:hypothetical protein EVA_16132 [gut metagenome]|uniref:Uncharacterized protein n=1 Tax=gut metagenome TaxID=749906 RepID=J9G1S7_9ZZZZ
MSFSILFYFLLSWRLILLLLPSLGSFFSGFSFFSYSS